MSGLDWLVRQYLFGYLDTLEFILKVDNHWEFDPNRRDYLRSY